MERDIDEITGEIVDAAVALHKKLGPGLLVSVYEVVLARELERRGLTVERDAELAFDFDGMHFDEGLRVDLLVEGMVVVELRSVEELAPANSQQVLTYLRLLNLSVGLLINFGGATLKEGLHRIVNHYAPSASAVPRLSVKAAGLPNAYAHAETQSRGERRERDIDEVSGEIVDAAVKLHMRLGPGLIESVYEMVLARELQRRGLTVERQFPVEFDVDEMHFDEGHRADLLVERLIVVELKSVEKLARVHFKQLLTYLRLRNHSVGLLLNFGGATLKEGLHRIVNNYTPSRFSSAAPRLRVNGPEP